MLDDHPPIEDHDHRADYRLAVGCVQGGEAVGEPRNAVDLAAARAVLVQATPDLSVLQTGNRR